MLRDLTKQDWQRLLAIDERRMPEAILLHGTRNLRRQAERHRRLFDDPVDVESPNGLFEDMILGMLDGRPIAYASVYGAAMAAEMTHLAAVLGARLVVLTGTCGAWIEGARPGDLFLPTQAFCGEGASNYYPRSRRFAKPNPELIDYLLQQADTATQLHSGGIYTTAALLAETTADIDAWHADGWQAVDLETATVLAVADAFSVHRVSLLSIFDNPRHIGDIVQESLIDARRAAGRESVARLALELIRDYLAGKIQCSDEPPVETWRPNPH